jgi:hypothetical protein
LLRASIGYRPGMKTTDPAEQPDETPAGAAISDPEVVNDSDSDGSGDTDTDDDLDAPDPS